MQIYAIGSAVLLLLASSSSVYARAIIYGWGERIVLVGDLPPDVRAQIRQETQQDVAIGFCYRYWYLFADGFDFWRWNGRYVVYGNNKYWNFTDDELLELAHNLPFGRFGRWDNSCPRIGRLRFTLYRRGERHRQVQGKALARRHGHRSTPGRPDRGGSNSGRWNLFNP